MKKKLEEILKAYSIDYVPSGKNVKKGNLGLNCPFCGDDSSYHLGINPDKGVYSCWREPTTHKGTVAYLISYLTGISLSDAKAMLGQRTYVEKPTEAVSYGGKSSLVLPDNFRVVRDDSVTRQFYRYFEMRGFDRVDALVKRYDIRCCISGKWADRVIFPLTMEGKLMSWVGRSISPHPYLRYRELEKSESVRFPKFCLFDYDNLQGGEKLFIFEGMFDALKLMWYTRYDSTCLFTLNITDEQLKLLFQISSRYKKLILLLDANAEGQTMKLYSKMSFLPNLEVEFLTDYKDFGEMDKKVIQAKYGDK